MMRRISPEVLAKVLHKHPNTIREWLINGTLPVAKVEKMEKGHRYTIYFENVREYMGISRAELKERLKEAEK